MMRQIILAEYTNDVVTSESAPYVRQIRAFVADNSLESLNNTLDLYSPKEQAIALNAIGFEKPNGFFELFSPNGGSCMHIVASPEMLNFLLQRGADHSSKNSQGKTFLEVIGDRQKALKKMAQTLRPLALEKLRADIIFDEARFLGNVLGHE